MANPRVILLAVGVCLGLGSAAFANPTITKGAVKQGVKGKPLTASITGTFLPGDIQMEPGGSVLFQIGTAAESIAIEQFVYSAKRQRYTYKTKSKASVVASAVIDLLKRQFTVKMRSFQPSDYLTPLRFVLHEVTPWLFEIPIDTAKSRVKLLGPICGEEQEPMVLVVDLDTGQVTGLSDVPADLLTNAAYKESKMVFRRIPAGTFTMGSPVEELGRFGDEVQHSVTLTQDFHMAIFEVTQAQYEAVMGNNPSEDLGAQRPVEMVSWNDVRGGTWPGGDPAAGSFMERMRDLCGGTPLFDLPTEAQWEYACRAGTTTALNSGKNLTDSGECPNVAEVARYWFNRDDGKGGYSHHTTVGSYLVNSWGLYDMHGNVWEWCLDWYGEYGGEETDPPGAGASPDRVVRGGGWRLPAQFCRSACRGWDDPGGRYSGLGFRPAARVIGQ